MLKILLDCICIGLKGNPAKFSSSIKAYFSLDIVSVAWGTNRSDARAIERHFYIARWDVTGFQESRHFIIRAAQKYVFWCHLDCLSEMFWVLQRNRRN